MDFDTQYRKHKVFKSESGSSVKILYSPKFDEDGSWCLVESGKTDLYSYIQSFADSVDLNYLLKRYEAGETDILQRVQGIYGDFSGMPETYIEMVNMLENGRIEFEQLPVSVKEKFGNSFEKFIASFGSEEFVKAFNLTEEKKDEEVKSSES